MTRIPDEEIARHGLTHDEYEQICDFMDRDPNHVELGIFSVMWSEHCSYKSSRAYLKEFPTKGPQVIQGPGENAGVVDIGDGLAVVFKMESHNHPSFIEPYQGAATGVGGILRDVFTMGARPIANLNSLRFGELNTKKMKYLVHGVVEGIAGYGNCMGIPTVGGEIYFDDCYAGNILVNAFTLGLAKADRIFYGTASGLGNPVIYVGSKTGRDGIHGATMASEEFDEQSEEKRPTVQVGDPFTEKLLLEACLELFKTDCLIGIQDMGAAGLTSSSFEMASRAGSGIDMYLSKVPLREEGMTPYEILLSESQERMLLVAKKGREQEVFDIFEKWGLDAATVGKVTDGGRFRIYDRNDELCADMPVGAVVDNCPLYHRPAEKPAHHDRITGFEAETLPVPAELNAELDALLSSPTIASKRPVYTVYDHMVRNNTVFRPGSSAALVRVKGTSKGIAMTTDCNARYCYLDPDTGGKIAVAEAARNIAATGAKPLAITDCLNYGNPEKPEIMWQFSESVKGMSAACRKLDTPVVSGNVSFYNETMGVGIFPTPTIGMVGLIENIENRIPSHFQHRGDNIILVGTLTGEVGGSEYLKLRTGKIQGKCPKIDLNETKAIIGFMGECAGKQLLSSANDASEGGIAVALAECCFGEPETGCQVDLESNGMRPDFLLFCESQNIMVLSCPPETAESVLKLAEAHGLAATTAGAVTETSFEITVDGDTAISQSTGKLKEIWDTALEAQLR
ncbi:MAG: phosphoribosylformylglycinamidine synthase subunit PurL [Acidobacteria bacterium CG_4_9_14_3_um_filter_49_7]|nr:MAG: phosphoribosylformylglycinamidine synthase subunit PurL [Acidobacteria bacterium CG_4_9_14_3_um_filter_49_7]